MKENPIKFGTDGWRAIIAREFTFDNVRICARAMAEYLKESGLAEKGLLIGYDTRFASEDFAAAAAETVAATGITVKLCGAAVPTPVVSFGTASEQAGGAIVITASHNPAAWNGFKIKSHDGASASPGITATVEKYVSRFYPEGTPDFLPLEEAKAKGLVGNIDLTPSYFKRLSDLVDIEKLKQSKLKIAVDPMYGAGMGYLKNILGGGNIEVIEINGERNPSFPGIQPEPIAPNLHKLSATIKDTGAQVGIATDGDADRLGIIDENGTFLTTLQVFSLLTLYLLEVRGERGLIGRSINTSVMIDRLAGIYGSEVVRTPIGFKYIAPLLLEKNAIIGGEESGGYGFRGHVPERDGILAALYFLDLMRELGKTPSQLVEYLYSKTGIHHYNRTDVHFDAGKRDEIMERVKNHTPQELNGTKVANIETEDGYKYNLEDGSWLLVRFSGTEPLLRIYAESSSHEKVEQLLNAGKTIAGV